MQPIRLWKASQAAVRFERLPTVYYSATLTEHLIVIEHCIDNLIRSCIGTRRSHIGSVPGRPQANHRFNDFV